MGISIFISNRMIPAGNNTIETINPHESTKSEAPPAYPDGILNRQVTRRNFLRGMGVLAAAGLASQATLPAWAQSSPNNDVPTPAEATGFDEVGERISQSLELSLELDGSHITSTLRHSIENKRSEVQASAEAKVDLEIHSQIIGEPTVEERDGVSVRTYEVEYKGERFQVEAMTIMSSQVPRLHWAFNVPHIPDEEKIDKPITLLTYKCNESSTDGQEYGIVFYYQASKTSAYGEEEDPYMLPIEFREVVESEDGESITRIDEDVAVKFFADGFHPQAINTLVETAGIDIENVFRGEIEKDYYPKIKNMSVILIDFPGTAAPYTEDDLGHSEDGMFENSSRVRTPLATARTLAHELDHALSFISSGTSGSAILLGDKGNWGPESLARIKDAVYVAKAAETFESDNPEALRAFKVAMGLALYLDPRLMRFGPYYGSSAAALYNAFAPDLVGDPQTVVDDYNRLIPQGIIELSRNYHQAFCATRLSIDGQDTRYNTLVREFTGNPADTNYKACLSFAMPIAYKRLADTNGRIPTEDEIMELADALTMEFPKIRGDLVRNTFMAKYYDPSASYAATHLTHMLINDSSNGIGTSDYKIISLDLPDASESSDQNSTTEDLYEHKVNRVAQVPYYPNHNAMRIDVTDTEKDTIFTNTCVPGTTGVTVMIRNSYGTFVKEVSPDESLTLEPNQSYYVCYVDSTPQITRQDGTVVGTESPEEMKIFELKKKDKEVIPPDEPDEPDDPEEPTEPDNPPDPKPAVYTIHASPVYNN